MQTCWQKLAMCSTARSKTVKYMIISFYFKISLSWCESALKCSANLLLKCCCLHFSLTVLEDAASLGHRIRPCRSLSPKGGILWVNPTAERRPFKSSSNKVKQQRNEIQFLWLQSVGQIHVFQLGLLVTVNHDAIVYLELSDGCLSLQCLHQ